MLFSEKIPADNETLRHNIYAGAIFKMPPTAASLKTAAHVTARLEKALGTPIVSAPARQTAQEFLDKMRDVRNDIINDDDCKQQARAIMQSVGFSTNENAFDVLRVRAVAPKFHLNPALARSYSLHRDTWYANPQCQVNWWIALQDSPAERTFSFYPSYFSAPLANTSSRFDYNVWMNTVGWQNTRGLAQVDYPQATQTPDPAQRTGFSCKAGEILLFSAAHLHQTNPNMSDICRYSLDFRTIHLDDLRQGKGAPNADNGSTSDAARDYIMPEGRGL